MNEQLLHQLELLEAELSLPHSCRHCFHYSCDKINCKCRCGSKQPEILAIVDTMRKILTDDYFQVQ